MLHTESTVKFRVDPSGEKNPSINDEPGLNATSQYSISLLISVKNSSHAKVFKWWNIYHSNMPIFYSRGS